MLGRLGFAAVAAFCLAACGKSVSFDKPDAKGSGGSDGGGGSDAAPGWQTLISLPWNIGAGSQTYECVATMVTEDMYVDSWSAMSPTGTHHQVLTVIPSAPSPQGLNNPYSCTGEVGTLNGEMLFAAGVGTGELAISRRASPSISPPAR